MSQLLQVGPPRIQFLNANGAPLVGGTVAIYIPSTTTPVTTYQDPNSTTANSNPITLDAIGSAAIWTNQLVRMIVEDADGNQIYDQVGGIVGGYFLAWGASNKLFVWGNNDQAADGVSDAQAYFFQNQPTFVANGSLGAGYFQKVCSWVGGAASDAAAPVESALRGYNQVGTGVTYTVECGALAQVDNFSYHAQGVGVFGQTNAYHGSRGWGAIGEAHEFGKTITATAGQTVFPVPNGFINIGAVSKNGTLLALTTDYTASSPNVTLTAGAAVGDVIKIWPSDRPQEITAFEYDVFVGYGTDGDNPVSGNRLGGQMFALRQDKTLNVATEVGTLLSLVVDPTDPYLTALRLIQPQGQFVNLLDFSQSNLSVSGAYLLLKGGGGIDNAQNVAFGTAPEVISGYRSLIIYNSTGGGLIKATNGTDYAQIQSLAAVGGSFQSSGITILGSLGFEGLRVNYTGGVMKVGFYGSSGTAKQTLASAATDPTSTMALANSLRTAIIALGLTN